MKSFLLVCLLAAFVCAFVQTAEAQSTNVLTCLLATNQSAAFSNLANLSSVYSVAVNTAGNYVFVVHDYGVYRYPFSASTGFNVSGRVRLGIRNVSSGNASSPKDTDVCRVARKTICNPITVSYDVQDRLWVTDFNLKRVVRYDAVSTADYTNKTARPKFAVGVATWTEDRQSLTNFNSFYLTAPVDTVYDNTTDTLYILENNAGPSRVLRYNLLSQTPIFGAVAQGVLGQTNSTLLEASTSVNSRTLKGAWNVAIDGQGDLYVVDSGNNRILRFENASYLENGAKANHWISQESSSSSNASVTRQSLSNPQGFYVDQVNELGFIADYNNNRVVVYDNVYKHTNQQTWDLVLGQDTFVNGTANQGQAVAGPRTLSSPYGPVFNQATGFLFVADDKNGRVVAYGACTGATNSPGVTPSVSAKVTRSGTVSANISPSAESTPGVTTTTGSSSTGTTTTGSTSTGTTGSSTGTTGTTGSSTGTTGSSTGTTGN